MADTADFTQGDIRKPIIVFAVPIFLSSILQQFYQIADSMVVSRMIGPSALAAVSASTTIVMAMVIIMNGFASGVSVFIAQLLGAKKEDQVTNLAYSTVSVLSVVCIAVSVIWIALAEPFLRDAMGTPDAILTDAVSYFRIYIASLVFMFIYNIYSFMLRAYGNSNASMYFLAIFSVVNIGLDILFVGPLKMGVFGAGLATSIAQALSAILSVWYVRKHVPALHIFTKHVKFDKILLKKALSIGIPNASQQLLLGMSNLFLQKLVNSFGTATIAAQGLEYRVSTISTQIGLSISRSVAVFTGQNKGAKKFDRIREAMRFLLVVSIVMGVAITALIIIFNRGIVSLFIDTKTADAASAAEVVLRAGRLISIAAVSYTFMMVANLYFGLLRGAGDTLFSMIGAVAIVVIRISSAYLLAYFTELGYLALSVSMIVMWVLASLGMYLRYKSGKWKDASGSLVEDYD